MAAFFNADEILQIAVDIERNGKEFYSRAAELVTDESLKNLLRELSEWEAGHEVTFSRMRDKYRQENEESRFLDPDNEASKYLKAIADGKVFERKVFEKQLADISNDPHSILKTAMMREKDAVVFFTAIREVVPEQLGKNDVAKIVEEEFSHIRFIHEKISQLKS